MGEVALWLAALVVGSALLTWALRREHKRIEREARAGTVTVTFEVVDRLTPKLLRLRDRLTTLVPPTEQAARRFKAFGEAMQIQLRDATPATAEQVAATAAWLTAAQPGDGGDAAAGES